MAKKAIPSKIKEGQKKLAEPKVSPKPKPKTTTKKTAQTTPEEEKSHYIPRGERGDFLKTTITISAEMLTELRALGMKRKSAKQKDTDTSALIREALTDFLKKSRT